MRNIENAIIATALAAGMLATGRQAQAETFDLTLQGNNLHLTESELTITSKDSNGDYTTTVCALDNRSGSSTRKRDFLQWAIAADGTTTFTDTALNLPAVIKISPDRTSVVALVATSSGQQSMPAPDDLRQKALDVIDDQIGICRSSVQKMVPAMRLIQKDAN